MPQAFDHAITQARVNGAIHWLDGTQIVTRPATWGISASRPSASRLVVSDESEALTRGRRAQRV